ncbi:hypothetical protein [Henriciella sp.]|uniref:hypothetical protein n=1 Tax=Henriciella sp. TaxID=1968823 RepID=UPI00261099DC|nr:hypothetical protein [Henriciella sp.]
MTFLRSLLRTLCLAGLIATSSSGAAAQASSLGREVTNTAHISYEHESGTFRQTTNPASFVVEARRSPSQVSFFRLATGLPGATALRINTPEYSPSGSRDAAAFIPLSSTTRFRTPAPVNGDMVELMESRTFFRDDLVFLRVIDPGHNSDPTRVESIIVRVHSGGDDEIILRLHEDEADSGAFYGYVMLTAEATPAHDNLLTTRRKSKIHAEYEDAFDREEKSVESALVDPYGRVFDSTTGTLLDDVEVTLIREDTGEPAEVFGLDGVSPYPSSLTTGSTVSDQSGRVYTLEHGEFLFPLVAPGPYRLEITSTERHAFPSSLQKGDFNKLENGPFEIIPESFGLPFEVLASGPLNLDVPMDSNASLIVSVQTPATSAAHGDFVAYNATVENRHASQVSPMVVDDLPGGFRYVPGSTTLNGTPVADPEISSDGQRLIFDIGNIPAGDSAQLGYLTSVNTNAAKGWAVNTAWAANESLALLSNKAETRLRLRDDLFTSEMIVMGRVSDRCVRQAEQPDPVSGAAGIEGVRLYLETGRYAISDINGLYRFEGLEPGTHVVQLDMETLPEGYEAVACETNTRLAGSAISQFVEGEGGSVWQANFYLRNTGTSSAKTSEEVFSDVTEYLAYDQAWLDTQAAHAEWVYPAASRTASSKSVNIGLKLPRGAQPQLRLNGRPVPVGNRQQSLTSANGEALLHRWRGIDIQEGENQFEVLFTDGTGRPTRLERAIWFVDEIEQSKLVADQSTLAADGRTPPVIALRIENAAGKAVHAGRLVDVSVNSPYRLHSDDMLLEMSPVIGGLEALRDVSVDHDGIARVILAPTLQTGHVRVRVSLADGQHEDIDVYLRPEARDWVMVGLGEAGLELDNAQSLLAPKNKDARLAFFAKGLVRGDWLLTAALDTRKRRGARDDELFDIIDPNAYYTLYGDRSHTGQEAASNYPFYVKLEKAALQFLLGDFNTDLADTELARYSRKLTGARLVHEGETFSASGFAAETNQRFARDEIAADGTSGPYRLKTTPIARFTETIRVETRDRVRPDRVLSTEALQRFVDYDLDYETGELIFRQPVDPVDTAFNERVIVAEYETFSNARRALSYGGRLAARMLENRLEAGFTHIHEADPDAQAGNATELSAVDVTAHLNDNTKVRVEAAQTRRDAESTPEMSGTAHAYLVEVLHQSEMLQLNAYVREEDSGYGLGQTAQNTRAIRRTGAATTIRVDQTVTEKGLASKSVALEAYREEALDTDHTRTVAEGSIIHNGPALDASLGLRTVAEDLSGQSTEAVLATGSLVKRFSDIGLTATVSHEQPLSGGRTTLFPQRTLLGLDKTINKYAQLNLRHEITDGEDISAASSTVGVTLRPWSGNTMRADLGGFTQDSARQLTTTMGVDQTLKLTEAWSASIGFANRSLLDESHQAGGSDAFPPDSPLIPRPRNRLSGSEAFQSGYLGIGHRSARMATSVRAEYKDTSISTRKTLVLGSARELTEALSFAGGARWQDESGANGQTESQDARLGLAWRPRNGKSVLLNRFDFIRHARSRADRSAKFVSNTNWNSRITRKLETSLFHGLKFTEATHAGRTYSGWSHLLGGEVRHDLTPKLDIGVRGSIMSASATRTYSYSIGPVIGFSPRKNLWVSAGYNFSGFEDDDFEEASYSKNGLTLRLRFKFDQTDLDGLLDWVSPHEKI